MVDFSKGLATFVKEHRELVKYVSLAIGTLAGFVAGIHLARAAIQMIAAAYKASMLAILTVRRGILAFQFATDGASKAMKALQVSSAGTEVAVKGASKVFSLARLKALALRVQIALTATAIKTAELATKGWNVAVLIASNGLTILKAGAAAVCKTAIRLGMAFGPYVAIAAAVAGAGYLIYKNWDKITGVFRRVCGSFSEEFPNAAKVIEYVYNTVIKPTVDLIKAIFSGLVTIIEGAFDLDTDKMLEGFRIIVSGIETFFSDLPIVRLVKAACDGVVDFLNTGFNVSWSAAWEKAKTSFASVFSGFADIIKAPINAAIALINSALDKINEATGFLRGNSFAKTLGLDVPEIPKIPMLAEGGIISSPTLAVVGEGGESEAVLPISKLREMLGERQQSSTVQPFDSFNQRELPSIAPAQTGGGFGLSSLSVNFAPVINVTSSESDAGAQVSSALRQGQIDLKRELEQLLRNQRRLAGANYSRSL
jgi:SLT domain-containing protein